MYFQLFYASIIVWYFDDIKLVLFFCHLSVKRILCLFVLMVLLIGFKFENVFVARITQQRSIENLSIASVNKR